MGLIQDLRAVADAYDVSMAHVAETAEMIAEDEEEDEDSAQSEQLNPEELGNTYLSDRDRFVVSLIVGYAEEDGPKYPNQAAAAALALTRDDGSTGTQWWVYDRQTKVMHMLEQSEFEGLPFEDDDDIREDESENDHGHGE